MEYKHVVLRFCEIRRTSAKDIIGASYAVVPQKPLKKDIYRKMKKTSRRMRPESEWIIIPTPAIIDRELFMRSAATAQRQLRNGAQKQEKRVSAFWQDTVCVRTHQSRRRPPARQAPLLSLLGQSCQLSSPANVYRERGKRTYSRRTCVGASGAAHELKGVDAQTG